jgi:hypothetical protein
MEVFLLIIQNNYPKVPKIGNSSKLHQTKVDNQWDDFSFIELLLQVIVNQ